jgi:aryl-alcohol dehydrogenase-like predicted oxidoreductase
MLGVPRRRFGLTDETVSMLGLGGFHLGKPSEGEAIEIMHRAIDAGLTFFDNCWDYHDGESERRMGKALTGGKRDKVFLMTKLDGRDRISAGRQLEQSLERLRTDVIDLVQVHEVIRPDDPTRVFASGGAIEALTRARDQGKIRYIGFTGHKDPKIHHAMLREAGEHGFRFDAVQMPLNVMDPHFRSFERNVLPELVQLGIAPLAMKPLGSGKILESGVVSASECLRYALSLSVSVVITGCERISDLHQALEVARGFEPMTADEITTILGRTAHAARRGDFELFKTSTEHDGTSKSPQWLTSAEI